MDYSKLSDVEINHAVASVLPGRYITYPDHVMNSETEEDFDPCNNPADAWPIIVNSRINLTTCVDLWSAVSGGCQHFHENPLRGAMIVFLMVQGGKDDK
ncbi:MAG: DUF2591 family protein [Enterobacter sp.]|jgi:hypothetical protein|nr:DUF2591 family protein [Enterobacter sp.]